MAYDLPLVVTYNYAWADCSASIAQACKGPSGAVGYVVDITACVLTTTAGATTTPVVQVGLTGTLAAYATLDIGALTAPEAANGAGTGLVIPADTTFLVGLVAATGGGAAGACSVNITIDWR